MPTPGSARPEDRLRTFDLEEDLRDGHRKQRFVTTMFEVIATRYDRFTRLFSFGMDRRWKRTMLAELADVTVASPLVIDVACGTGDLAFGTAARIPDARIVGFDVARRMLTLARQRAGAGHPWPRFAAGDMTSLPVGSGSAHAVLAGYAIRNAPDPGTALREIARVLQNGGLLVALDFYRPRNRVWRWLFVEYLRLAGNLTGWLWHRQPVTYGYIAASIRHHVSWQDLSSLLAEHGFLVGRVHRRLLGGIAIHVASREGARSSG